MRLLVDANLCVRVAERLRKAAHDASHVADHGLLEADDNAIMAFAAQESAVVVSADSDFATMLALGRIAAWARGSRARRSGRQIAGVTSETSHSAVITAAWA